MLSEKYITASCTIGKGIVNKNGIKAFENSNADTPGFLLSLYQHFKLNYPKFYKMDNLSKLCWLASEILLKDDFKPHLYQPEQVGIVLANANSSLDDDIKYYASVKDVPSPSLFVYTLPNIMIGEICIRNNFKGEHALFVQEEFNAGFIETQVNYLLDNDLLEACICGWGDVLEQDYKAVLFLVEKEKGEQSLPFSKDNMNSIFISN
ncbi:MAG TPA: hypothetical protein VNW95_06910 [Mucilaginibacter sp.]|nr:hypothetical protein [Mucilaginibacter sp.]